jgi:hypothetical protein
MSTQTKPFSEWTDEELMNEVKSLHDIIYNVECFGVNDLMWYELILKELEKRGYEIQEDSYLQIEKEEEDAEKDES